LARQKNKGKKKWKRERVAHSWSKVRAETTLEVGGGLIGGQKKKTKAKTGF